MKKLSEYEGDEALELWADLLDPLSVILTDDRVRKVIQSGKSKITIAREIIKFHKKEAVEIMLRIDPTPINGLNVILRLIALLADIGENEEIKSFFGYAAQVKTDSASSGFVMVSTEESES